MNDGTNEFRLFFLLMFLLFLGLKLGGVVTWSWWWVFAPLWGPLALALFFFALAMSIRGWNKLVG